MKRNLEQGWLKVKFEDLRLLEDYLDGLNIGLAKKFLWTLINKADMED